MFGWVWWVGRGGLLGLFGWCICGVVIYFIVSLGGFLVLFCDLVGVGL